MTMKGYSTFPKASTLLESHHNIILLILCLFVFICRASRICSHSLFISCAIMVVFSTRIFQNLDLGIEWVLRCKATDLESLQCIVSRLKKVVVVRSTYALFSLKTQSPKRHLNIYMMFVLSRSLVEGEVLLEIIRLEVLTLL